MRISADTGFWLNTSTGIDIKVDALRKTLVVGLLKTATFRTL